MRLHSFSEDVRRADLFFAELVGEPVAVARSPEASVDEPWTDGFPEPFFGDGPDDRWIVVGEPGAMFGGLRDDDLVVRRIRRDDGIVFRARLASRLSVRPVRPWPVPRDTVVLRRVRRRLPRPAPEPVVDRPVEQQIDQQPYLPQGGRAFVPQPGVFTCAPPGFVVVPAAFLPQPTANADAAIDAALAGLSAAERGRVTRAGLRPIAAELGARALTELVARLRWSAADIEREKWARGAGSLLVPRLLLHVPGHFRELARRAPDAREAFVLECLGWLLMARLRRAVEAATRRNWWVPPAPAFVTAVPNPIPPLSAEVSALIRRWLLIDTTLPINTWNASLTQWGSSLAGRQWQAEIHGTQPGRPFYAGLATIPAHMNTAAQRAQFQTAWQNRVAAVDASHPPHAAGATTVTLSGLQNATTLRDDAGTGPFVPAQLIARIGFQGLELAAAFPDTTPRIIRDLPLLAHLWPVYEALFRTIRELGWNDLLYQTGGGFVFRGVKQSAAARVTIGGSQVLVNPFNAPDATTVTRINTLFTPQQRAKVLAKCRTARSPSNHGVGAAIDFNTEENDQGIAARPFGSMDPRIVSVFQAFHFRFGACFPTTDPMHFEYCEAPCAPAAATTGPLGPVVTPNLLLPLAAGRVTA
jgi:D-alanyl-D-alanine carboxypeptidase